MNLFFRHYGTGTPLIILHGLYGSSDNWITIGRKLAENFEVFLLDQRNHGNSFHSKEHNYTLLKNDLYNFMIDQNINKAILLGHSMGGKTAMFFAADYPDKVISLIIADISPRSYKDLQEPVSQVTQHMNIMSSMLEVDFTIVKSRTDVDRQLASLIRSGKIRQFLLKNIARDEQGNYKWKLNIRTLFNHLPEIMDGLDLKRFSQGKGITGFPVLFIKGENSDYISAADIPIIYKVFPEAELVNIPGAGHWLHAEQPDIFINVVEKFLEELSGSKLLT